MSSRTSERSHCILTEGGSPSEGTDTIPFKHTRHGQRPWRTFGTNVHRVLLCFLLRKTFVPNVRPVVHARQDAYVLWMRSLDISEGLRPTVNMQWDLSEVLQDAYTCLSYCTILYVFSLRTHCMRPYIVDARPNM